MRKCVLESLQPQHLAAVESAADNYADAPVPQSDQVLPGNLSGKCADLNGLFTALSRASGVPARDVYGVRVDDSVHGFKSLGKSGDISKAQHCRAEFYSPGYGWVPVNPSDVRKAIQSEGLSNHDPKLTVLKKLLFGFWEMNWVSFNAAQDVELQGSAGKPLPFLITPVVESQEGRFDDPSTGRFAYSVTAQRV